jgi:hypothetical protein
MIAMYSFSSQSGPIVLGTPIITEPIFPNSILWEMSNTRIFFISDNPSPVGMKYLKVNMLNFSIHLSRRSLVEMKYLIKVNMFTEHAVPDRIA